jgi:acetyl/propionyl-CoA carboxylase alpha subunit
MRRALQEYTLIGVRTTIPFHQRLMDSPRFMGGQYDTRFVEERFSIDTAASNKVAQPEVAALIASLVAHQQTQRAAHIIQRGKRDTTNWKWISRWERLQK